MGWLFGKKKVKAPHVPFPKGHAVDEGALRFPHPSPKERVIQPHKVKQAVGFEKPIAFPKAEGEMDLPPPPPGFAKKKVAMPAAAPRPPREEQFVHPAYRRGPLFVKVDVYQRILGELDALKEDVSHLRRMNQALEESEFNEEGNFARLKRSIRVMHDRMLQVDSILFKSQGE